MARPLRSAPVTGASPLLRDGPPPCPGPVLCLSRFLPLEELPPPRALRHGDPRATGSPVPRKSLDRARALFTPDAAGAADRYPPGSSQDRIHSPGSDITLSISTLPQGFGFTRLHDPHLTRSCRAFSATLTTPALNRRSSRWFAASSCKAAAEGLPPSLAQHRRQQAAPTRPAGYRSGHTYAAAFFRNSSSIFCSRVSRSSSRSRARSFTVSGGSSPACSRR